MKNYRELDIFKDAKRLAVEVHKISLLLPKLELYEGGSQIRRSSKAVAALIVEGYRRKRYKTDSINIWFTHKLNVMKQYCTLTFCMKRSLLRISRCIRKYVMSMMY